MQANRDQIVKAFSCCYGPRGGWSAAAGVVAIAAFLVCGVGGAYADNVTPGNDYWVTASEGTYLDFIGEPLPSDFFGPGSDPFEGQIALVGEPLDPGSSGDSSTIVHRDSTAVLPPPYPTSAIVDVRMTALLLHSANPITVTFWGGIETYQYEVVVTLDSDHASSGTMMIQADDGGGGIYSGINMGVYPSIQFLPLSPLQSPIDWRPGEPPFELTSLGAYAWQHEPFIDPPYPGQGPNFFPLEAMNLQLRRGGILGRHPVYPPRQITGCCYPDGSCVNLDSLACFASGGTPMGQLCQGQAACCLPDGGCIMADVLCCEVEFGGVPIFGGACANSIEACCDGFLPFGCRDEDAACCVVVDHATPQGPGTACQGDGDGSGIDDACEAPVACGQSYPACDGDCPPDTVCTVSAVDQSCYCAPIPCENSTPPTCGGTCPPDFTCVSPDAGGPCYCEPVPCEQSTWPDCTGTCDPGQVCVPDPTGGQVCVCENEPCEPTADLLDCEPVICPDPTAEECVPVLVHRNTPGLRFPIGQVDFLRGTGGQIEIEDPSGGIEIYEILPDLEPNITVVERGDPEDLGDHRIVATQIVDMQLVAMSEFSGAALVHLSTLLPSPGLVTGAVGDPDGSDFPAESFFDVFVEVDLPEVGALGLRHLEPIHIEATGVTSLPPWDHPFETPAGWLGVDLVDATGFPTGFRIIRVIHIPPPPPQPWEVLICECLPIDDCHVQIAPGEDPKVFCEGACPPGQICNLQGTDTNADGTNDTFACECLGAPEACCLPGVVCEDRTYDDCIAGGGVPQGTGTDCSTTDCQELKWTQYPDPQWSGLHAHDWQGAPVDPLSITLADDWLCDGGVVTDLHWWGTYENNDPGGGLDRFHLSIHADNPAGPDGWPVPAEPPLWQTNVPLAAVNETPTGLINNVGEQIFFYTYILPDPFVQEQGNWYWFDITAISVDPVDPVLWKWQEARRDVAPPLGHAPAAQMYTGDIWHSIIWPGMPPGGQDRYSDMAFVITSRSCLIAGPLFNDPIPTPVDIGFGTKNRYLSFMGGTAGQLEAVQVTFANLPDFPFANGRTAWVQEPYLVTEASGSSGPTPLPTMWAARLGCNPFYTDWSAYGTVHVFDDGIVPGSSYELRLIDSSCDCHLVGDYGPPLGVSTSAIGDVVGDCGVTPCSAPQGVVDFVDISSIVDKFRNLLAAPNKARADIINSDVANPIPDQKIDFVDISYCVDAFRNLAAPPPGPPAADPCPGPCP